ncbi:MauE/DoxX family redox-associated membrane protein [Nonomuraea mangrovi]|uniref:MauE/DoxX family redox-associated membrane protein n=1 Tax=Nonomuraea mangrovi TaxID=2316207 RepID=A0ABW4SM84_9ACTN
MQGIAALQPYLIAAFLVWAALLKLLDRRMRSQAGQTALALLVGSARAIPTFRLIGLVELAVAAALLAPPALPAEGAAATALSIGFLGYLTYSSLATPTSSCGCLGAHAQPVNWRAFTRAGLLLAMSVTAVWATPFRPDTLLVLLGAAEAVALLGLSPELDRHWLRPLRQFLVRLRRPLAVPPPQDVPLETSLRLLYLSPAYCTASAHLTSDVQDVWDEDVHRFASYAAAGGRTAIFAIPLSGDDPAAVRVALVDEPAAA